MLPLRCLPLLLLYAVVIYCDEATETLIEMKDEKLDVEETTVPETMEEDDGKEVESSKGEKVLMNLRENILISVLPFFSIPRNRR
jgi:hypothetical protein